MEFQDKEFEPSNNTLKDLKKKIIDKGLSFHPYLALQAIQSEVETQLKDIVVNHFKGMTIEMLGMCSAEIKEYAESEEARWQEFQKSKQAQEQLLNSSPNELLKDTMPVDEVQSSDNVKVMTKKNKKK